GYDIFRKPPADFAQRAGAASAIITVSEANARYIAKTFGVPAAHIHVIPCGVDGERFSPRGERLEPPHVVCVARLKPVKNLGLLLEACAALQARGVEFRCVLVGEGPCRDDLEAMRARLGGGRRSVFRSRARWMACSDCGQSWQVWGQDGEHSGHRHIRRRRGPCNALPRAGARPKRGPAAVRAPAIAAGWATWVRPPAHDPCHSVQARAPLRDRIPG